MSLRAQRSLGVASIVVAALAYRQLLFWNPGSIRLPPIQAWLVLPSGTSPQLIFALVAALLYRKRGRLREAVQAHGSPALAILPLLGGFSLFVWGNYVEASDLILVSFVLVSLGASLLRFGVRFARELALPLVVLLFAIPLPAVLARHATALLSLMGFPLFREGSMVYGAGVPTLVIDSCSGLRFMEILTLLAILYVAWFPARRARGVLLVALAPAVAYVFNLARTCLMIVYPTSQVSGLHTLQGVLVFPGALLCLALADYVLGHLLPSLERQDELGPTTEPLGTTGSNGGRWAVALATLLVSLFGVSVWMPRWSPPETGPPASISLPLELNGWRQGRGLPLDQLFLATLEFSTYAQRRFQRNDERVSVFIGLDDRSRRLRSLLSPKNAFPGRGWEVQESGSVTLDPCGVRAEKVLARSDAKQRHMLSYHWYEGTDGLVLETLRALLATEQSPFARLEPARVIRVATVFRPTPGAPAQAEARLHRFACSLGHLPG
jgi:EpsI family protein